MSDRGEAKLKIAVPHIQGKTNFGPLHSFHIIEVAPETGSQRHRVCLSDIKDKMIFRVSSYIRTQDKAVDPVLIIRYIFRGRSIERDGFPIPPLSSRTPKLFPTRRPEYCSLYNMPLCLLNGSHEVVWVACECHAILS